MIIQTMSIHYTLAVPKKRLKNFKTNDPEVAYALATAAVGDQYDQYSDYDLPRSVNGRSLYGATIFSNTKMDLSK
jgi:hypothetical protein